MEDNNRTEDSTQKSKELFRTLLDTRQLSDIIEFLPDATLAIDKDRHIIIWNKAIEKMTGIPAAEMIGKGDYAYTIPFYGEARPQLMDLVFGEQEKIASLYPDIRREGDTLIAEVFCNALYNNKGAWVFLKVSPLHDQSGRIIGAIESIRDITERKQAEENLLFKTALLEAQSETSIDGILAVDKEGRSILLNKRFGELWKIPQHILDTKDDKKMVDYVLTQLLNPEEFVSKIAYLYNHYDEKSRDEIELADGRYFDRYSSPMISPEGKYLGRIWFFRDITKRRQAEKALKDALAKAEESDRLKTAFINNISHEVRTPLNGIIGFGQFMLDVNLSQEEKELYLGILDKSSYRLINTITGIMDISLIISGNMTVHKKTFYVRQFLEDIHLNFEKQCAEINLTLSLLTPDKTDNLEIHTDSALLGKTLFHLLDNAVKFTKDGEITFGYTNDYNKLRFFVKDTGVGISSTAHTRIFENFMQEDTSIKRGHEGSGLGLSIAKGIVELLGGEISLESVKGEGSTFFFTIPLTAAVKTPDICPAHTESLKPVILIAEDDETSRLFIKAILKTSSVTLLYAINGKEAVELVREHNEISLILMDLKMPVMNGLEAAKLIKSFRKDLPVIAVTAHAEAGAEHRALEAGCDDYIAKPLNKDLLIKKLEKFGVLITL